MTVLPATLLRGNRRRSLDVGDRRQGARRWRSIQATTIFKFCYTNPHGTSLYRISSDLKRFLMQENDKRAVEQVDSVFTLTDNDTIFYPECSLWEKIPTNLMTWCETH